MLQFLLISYTITAFVTKWLEIDQEMVMEQRMSTHQKEVCQ